jgi:type IV pilus assembly protein PilQ
MKRKAIILLTVTWLMLGMVSIPRGCAWAASEAATLKSVTLSAGSTGAELVLRVDGDYSYKTVQASPDTLFIDLAGAKADGIARRQQWVNPAFSGYRVLAYKDASGQPVVRVQVDTKQATPFVVQKSGSKLRLIFGKELSASAAPLSVPAASTVRAAAPVIPSASSGKPLLVSKITVDKHDSDETFVDISTSQTASYHVTTFAARLVVDIDGAVNTSPLKEYPADTAVLKGVRIGQFRAKDPSVVRVVADMNGNPAFDVHTTPAGIRMELRPRGQAKSAPLATAAPAPQAKPEESKPVETAAGTPSPAAVSAVAEPASTVTVSVRNTASAPPQQAEIHEAVKPDVQSTLPINVSSNQAAAAPLPPPASDTPEALRAEHAARVLTVGKGAEPSAAQTPLAAAAPSSPPATDQPKVYTGEPISVNLKDVDLKDFFRLIHEISGLNIIIDPNVQGSVTMVLDSVPWDQALDIVLHNNRLGQVLEGNVLRIARVETLTAEQDSQAKLADARMNAAPVVTVFRPINYAKASDIATLLKTWAGGGALTKRGTVLVDARGNTLIISDVQTQIPVIMNIVSKLDKKAKQVSIEARVVLATADFTRTLSAALSGSINNKSGTTVAGGATGSGATIAPNGTTPPNSGLTIPALGGSGFGAIAITNASSRYLINAVISAQEERDQAKTISRPTIVTQNNVQGTVMQGTQVPIQTTVNNTVSVQYANATLQLTVTPQVTDDDNIFLVINVQNNSVGATIATIGPEIDTQQATTSVLVPDGGTVVFGGITVTSRSKSATYVPWLGSIPLLGNLFKTSNVTDSDKELLFFVSPKVLPG